MALHRGVWGNGPLGVLLCGAIACGSDDASSTEDGTSDADGTGTDGGDDTGGTSAADDGGSGSSGSADGDADTSADTTADATGDGTSSGTSGDGSTGGSDSSTGDTSGTSGTTGSTGSTGSTTSGASDTGTTGGSGECEDANEWAALGHIWVANSGQGTVSKIDTQNAVELARYTTAPGTDPEPSRTAVNLYGDVAVASRGSQQGSTGHVTKIAGHLSDCVDRNGVNGIETSQNPSDVLPWMQDECVLWTHEVPSDTYEHGPRPLGWQRGPDGDCGTPTVNLWIGWMDHGANLGKFALLNGATGVLIDETDTSWSGLNYGPYGGAMDGDGNFWAIGWQQGPLARIDPISHLVTTWAFPTPHSGLQWSYGMALDQWGNPWIASSGQVATFDAGMEQWSWFDLDHLSVRGVAADREDRIWFAIDGAGPTGTGGCGLAVVDALTKTIVTPLAAIAGCQTPVGVAIDADGYVWVVDEAAQQAFKIEPDTYAVEATVTGLLSPYTYSDMTGANLYLVANPPG